VGSLLADELSQLMQGGQIVLQCMFETFVGSDQQAEAGGVTISITAATDSTGQTVRPQAPVRRSRPRRA
jgi:hypothetical protein